MSRGTTRATRRPKAARVTGITLAPMPGLVKAVFVVLGDVVAAGDRLAVLEAMQMRPPIAPRRWSNC